MNKPHRINHLNQQELFPVSEETLTVELNEFIEIQQTQQGNQIEEYI